MKIIILISFLISIGAYGTTTLEAHSGSQVAFVKVLKKTYGLKGFDHEVSVPKSKCSARIMGKFVDRFEGLYHKAISFKAPKTINITYKGKKKSVQPDSDLGQYFQNFSQIIITLKKEVELSCK